MNNTLEPVQLGNVFLEDEPVRVGVNIRGGASWQLQNFVGEVVLQGHHTGTGELRLELPRGERGHYVLSLTADGGGQKATTSLAVLEPFDLGAVDNSPFGVCTHFGQLRGEDTDLNSVSRESPEVVPLIGLAGFKTHRDELTWIRTEPVKGTCVFPNAHRHYMASCGEHAVGSLIILDYGNRNYDGGDTPHTDEGLDGFANYARQIVRRYGAQIKEVEVWNEYNGSFSKGPAKKSPEGYFELLKRTYRAVKEERPDLKVIGPAGVTLPYSWLDKLFALGALEYLDAVSVHPYIYPRQPDTVKDSLSGLLTRLQNLIKHHNGGEPKPLQLTEIGWPTHRGGVLVRDQARYAVRSFVMALSVGVERMFWYNFLSTGADSTKKEHNFGLLHHLDDPRGAYTPKPAYVALAVLARQLTGAHFREKEATPDPIYSYLFERDGEPLRVMWVASRGGQDSGAVAFNLRAREPLTVTDMVGKVRRLEPQGGDVRLGLSASPIYVRGQVEDSGPASEGFLESLRRLFG